MYKPIKLPDEVTEIFSILEKNGYDAFVVGGCVRDSLLGITPRDWDICTPALAPEVECIFIKEGYKVIETGIKHGTVTVVINDKPFEITTYRRDGNYSDGRHPDGVEFTSDLKSDLSRRDFTMNAIAYSPSLGFVDPFKGKLDIVYRTIKCVGNPMERFKEDSLRILRALRLSAQLTFSIESETKIAMQRSAIMLSNVSPERINSELYKILASDTPQYIMDDAILVEIIPEFEAVSKCDQYNKYHYSNVWSHTLDALAVECTGDVITRIALLFHDIGKPKCKVRGKDGYDHFYKHAVVGAEMADEIMKRLRFDNETREKVIELVKYHDAEIVPKESSVKRWLNRIGEEQFRRLLNLKICDTLAHKLKYCLPKLRSIFATEQVLENILKRRECFSTKDLEVNGNDLISAGFKEGKELGNILGTLLTLVIDGTLPNQKEVLIEKAALFLNGNECLDLEVHNG